MKTSHREFRPGPFGTLPLALAVFATWSASCGSPGQRIEATIEAPEQREALVTITPVVDLSHLVDRGLVERIDIEEIRLNLGDVRMLGIDPRLPSNGLDLLERETVIAAASLEDVGVSLAFPRELLDADDLAVYMNVVPTALLEGASVIVRARLYARAIARSIALTAAQDPDGDPARDPDRKGAQDPDGDPADDPEPYAGHRKLECARGGNSTVCTKRHALVGREVDNPSIPIVLRDETSFDLLATIDDPDAFDVVVGLPFARWFDDAAIADLDRELRAGAEAPRTKDVTHTTSKARRVNITIENRPDELTRSRPADDPQTRPADGREDDYFLTTRDALRRNER